MTLVEQEIQFGNEKFVLTNLRAMFWQEEKSLVLSDLHLGKIAHFRKNGIALPQQIVEEDLKRLTFLIQHYQPYKIIIVGDFIHAGENSEFELFKTWRAQFPAVEWALIKGNHDRIISSKLEKLGVTFISNTLEIRSITFSHNQIDDSSQFVISGHLHPGLSLKTPTKRYMKFPCYIVNDRNLILPAFSTFTGLDTKNHPENSSYYYFTKEGIYFLD